MRILLVGILTIAALAGCVSDDAVQDATLADCAPGDIDPNGVEIAPLDLDISYLVESDPWDASATNYRTCGFDAINRIDLRDGDPHGYIGEIDMRGDLDLGAVAVLGNGEAPMIYLLDISDRANPVVLSTIEQSATYIVDVKISDDGDFLFAASQNLPTDVAGIASDLPEFASPAGFTIYDISDRSNPVHQQTIVAGPQNLGCHMLSHEIIDGTDVVFCISQQVEAHGFLRAGAGVPWVYLGPLPYLLPDGDGTILPGACINTLLLTGVAGVPLPPLFCSGPHDMTVQVDAVDGRTYMVVSHWDEGLRVVDVSQPINDGYVTVGTWDGEGATHYDGNVHSAMMFWVGDKRYVVASPEMTYPGVTPSMWILDATDLDGQLELVGEWYHPSEYQTPGLLLTTHQWQVAPAGPDAELSDVRIYLTMNHAGVWVLGFEEMLAMDHQGAIKGFHMARPQLDQSTEVGNAILSTWDVNVVDGYVYGSDRATGLWIFHYAEDELGDSARTGWA